MDVAALNISINTDSVKQGNAEVKELGRSMSAAEVAAKRWGTSHTSAAQAANDFSRRVQATLGQLEFERQQLARNATEAARYAAVRRAGVAATSAEGQAIMASSGPRWKKAARLPSA
jgi:hypothetical protein